jgi:hypothetical protein
MIAATRAIVVTQPRRGAPASSKPAVEETRIRAVVDAVSEPRNDIPMRGVATTLPLAPFVAQLIATHQALPQTRTRNRAEAADAALAYRKANHWVA